MPRRCWFSALILTGTTVLVGCGSDSPRATSSANAGPTTKSESTSGVQAALQKAVNRFPVGRSTPGVSVAVIVDGNLFRAVGGLADVEADRKVDVDDEFRIASITKNFVAALAVDLSRAGVLGLDDTVGRWLPDLPDSLARMRDATLRQLLSHTSGLTQTFTADQDRGRVLSTADDLERIPPSTCDPGRCWSYADGNYLLAGLILEAATGTSLSTALDDHFLTPLGLTHTHFISADRADPVPQYVLASDEDGKPLTPRRFRRQRLPIHTNEVASGIQASASDLARWGHALFRARATPSGVVRTLLDSTPMRGLPCPDRCPYPYGLGVFHYTISGRELVGHDGSSGAVLAHDLDGATTIAIVTNGGDPDTGALLRSVLDALDARR